MSFENPSDEAIRAILGRPMTIAVVGCSPAASRDSHRIAALLQRRGHTVVPVNPHAQEVLGAPCYPSLEAVPIPIDMVDVFRQPAAVPAIAEAAIAVGARVLWLQLGVVHAEAAARARAAGLAVVMDRCPAIEYRRLFGGSDPER